MGFVAWDLVEPVPKKGLMVTFRRWTGGAGQGDGLDSSSYRGGLVRVGLESRRIVFAEVAVVACWRYGENRGAFVQKWLEWV